MLEDRTVSLAELRHSLYMIQEAWKNGARTPWPEVQSGRTVEIDGRSVDQTQQQHSGGLVFEVKLETPCLDCSPCSPNLGYRK